MMEKRKPIVLAICGMTGSGKSEAIKIVESLNDWEKVHYGGIVDKYAVDNWGDWTPEKSKKARHELREKYGMAALAVLSIDQIKSAFNSGRDVLIDGLYSWSEYKVMRENFGEQFYVLTIHASRKIRYERLLNRPERPMTNEQAQDRDYNEIETIEKGGPMVMSDFIVVNEADLSSLEIGITDVVEKLIK